MGGKLRAWKVVAILVVLFLLCNCGMWQCGASITGDVVQNQSTETGEAWLVVGVLILLLIMAMAGMTGGLGGR